MRHARLKDQLQKFDGAGECEPHPYCLVKGTSCLQQIFPEKTQRHEPEDIPQGIVVGRETGIPVKKLDGVHHRDQMNRSPIYLMVLHREEGFFVAEYGQLQQQDDIYE